LAHMAEFSVFDKLVGKLSSAERRSMLERIASSVEIAAPAAPEGGPEITVDVEAEYGKMGVLRRFIVVLVAMFTGRDKLSVVEARLLSDLRRRTASRTPDFDSVRDQLRPSALESFRRLASSARHFAAPLSRVMGRERAPFIAFLAGLHAPDVQQRLLVDSDPFAVSEKNPELKENEVKRRAVLSMEETLVTLPAEIRSLIYHDVRAIHHLMALASFGFERLLQEFTPVAGGQAVPVPVVRVANDLGKLAGILNGLYPGPSPVLLEALSVYQEQDRLNETDEEVEGFLRRDVNEGNEAYAEIVSFAGRYPVSDLVRLGHGNIHWRCVPLSGGEDWFAVWKGFWQERIDSLYRRYSFKRRVDELSQEAHNTLRLADVRPFPGYPPSDLDNPAKHGLSLGLARAAFGEVYSKELQGPLTVLYRDGEFYKADNRSEFDDAMREIERVRTDIANLEVRLQPGGDLGILWNQTVDGSLDNDVAVERQLALANQIDADSSALVRRTINVFRTIGNVLEGVLYGTVGGRYDTVSNLGRLGGDNAKEVTRGLEGAHARSKAIAELLGEMINLESLKQG
jgi:hypothetical protein